MATDLLLVPEQIAMHVTEGAAVALLRRLALAKQILPYAEAIARDWVEVYSRPCDGSADIFVRGPAPPLFREATLRWGGLPVALDWPGLDEAPRCFLAFYGTPGAEPNGRLRRDFQRCLALPARILTRPAGELPAHRVVGPDEKPEPKRKKEPGPGLAGIRWEEF